MHAWFSQKQKQLAGSSIYKTLTGDDVEVTHVAQNLQDGPAWDDAKYLGEVETWVRMKSASTQPKSNPTKFRDFVYFWECKPEYIKGSRSASE